MEKALTRWFMLHGVADEAPKTEVIWLPANSVVSKRPPNVLWTHSHGLQLKPDLAATSISHFLLHPTLSARPSYSRTTYHRLTASPIVAPTLGCSCKVTCSMADITRPLRPSGSGLSSCDLHHTVSPNMLQHTIISCTHGSLKFTHLLSPGWNAVSPGRMSVWLDLFLLMDAPGLFISSLKSAL